MCSSGERGAAAAVLSRTVGFGLVCRRRGDGRHLLVVHRVWRARACFVSGCATCHPHAGSSVTRVWGREEERKGESFSSRSLSLSPSLFSYPISLSPYCCQVAGNGESGLPGFFGEGHTADGTNQGCRLRASVRRQVNKIGYGTLGWVDESPTTSRSGAARGAPLTRLPTSLPRHLGTSAGVDLPWAENRQRRQGFQREINTSHPEAKLGQETQIRERACPWAIYPGMR